MSKKQLTDIPVNLPEPDYELMLELCDELDLSIEQITQDAVDKYNDKQRPKIKAAKAELNRIKDDLFN